MNGGFGYNPWSLLADITLGTGFDGGTYMSGLAVEHRQVDGNYSFGLFAFGTGFDISRSLVAAMSSGRFSILTRFDLAGNGPNLINLRSGNDTTAFGNGELLSFGIDGDFDQAELSYTDAAGTHVLPSGEARGAEWQWTVDFNTPLGTYAASVTNASGGFAATFNGHLEVASTAGVGSFAAKNSSIGSFQNLIFDSPTFISRTAIAPGSMPYKDSYVLQFVSEVDNGDGSRDQVYSGVGTNTAGGSFHVVVNVRVEPSEYDFNSNSSVVPFFGTETITVASGGTLSSAIAGAELVPLDASFNPLPPPFGLSGAQTVTGGTGRFLGASGNLTFTGLDFGNGTITISTKGTISTVGSNKTSN